MLFRSVTDKTGGLVGLLDVTEQEDLMITCVSGITIRMAVNKISELGRATQGVKLIKVDEGDSIAAITQLDEQEEDTELEETIVVLDENGNSEVTVVKQIAPGVTQTDIKITISEADPTEEDGDEVVEPEEDEDDAVEPEEDL